MSFIAERLNLLNFRALLTAAAWALLSTWSPVRAAPDKPVEVMVLGSYHFANPGRDINNMKVDSVLTPERQAELDALARALLTFRPTRVMVEQQSRALDLASSAYRTFTPDKLKTESNETVQIGFRVAKAAGLADVQAIDEQPSQDEPDYFPFDKVMSAARRTGQSVQLDAAMGEAKTLVARLEELQKSRTIAQMLAFINAPERVAEDRRMYYGLLGIGDLDDQAGADLNAMYYLRNAKIFAKLMKVARPGDRVLVVYGAGHGFWLRHFAEHTPGFRSVDPHPYLKRAGG